MADNKNVRNPLGPLIGSAEELASIGKNFAVSTLELGSRTIDTAVGVGKSATHFAIDTAKKPIELVTGAAETSLGLTESTIKNLGKFASGLLPTLGDRNPPSDKS